MRVTDAYQDRIVVQFGDHTHSMTIEQLAMLVRQAYWRMDYRSASYLARIIADALIESPPEANPETRQVHRNSETNIALRKKIKEHNLPPSRMPPPEQEEPEQAEDEEDVPIEPESEAH